MNLSPRIFIITVLMICLGAVPLIADGIDEPFYTVLFSRMLILSIGAVSLNLILGFGGMVSFGHAVYLGIGSYVVGIGTFHAVEDGVDWMANGFIHMAIAVAVSALAGLIIGAISLRTRGVYFIMITLAFAQMFYFVAVGNEKYGGDDGLSLYMRSDFAGLIDLSIDNSLYYLNFAFLLLSLYLCHRLTNSRFGMTLRGTKSNEQRMESIGFPVFRYRLVAFVIAGAICGLAGVLSANQTDFVSPAVMHWTRSGDLIIMVVLGGLGTLFGPVIGAVAFLLLEEFLSGITEYWQLFFGPMLVLVVIFARGGIDGMLVGLDRWWQNYFLKKKAEEN
ncbi:MAG: branched-chain amino acid ABC transporter permease [SAR324 cluster bacterium]|jgi:branched-chain amino acid transport system permease protein|nr:branched-chain amino acid ABC transporter permease [SAR324 cluster bacterium]MCH2266240.1 branched-chain amino acid ABC transporter permease [SAR324 cluster bacterium]